MSDIVERLRFYAAKKKWPKGLEPLSILLSGAADLLSEAEKRADRAEAEKTGLLQSLQHHTGCDHGVMAIRMLVDRAEAAERREKDARVKALEEAAQTAEATTASGYGEDIAAAIRALKDEVR